MIVQHDSTRPNDRISVSMQNSAKLVVGPFAVAGGMTAEAEFDLTPYQGGPFRLYVEADGSFSTDLVGDRAHYWLLAEAVLPERQYDQIPTGQVDENGQPIMHMVERPLDLTAVEITVFPLPEVA